MVITTKLYVEHPDLALAHTIQSCPDATVGVVSDAGTDPQHDAYFFWVEAPAFDPVETALEADHTVAEHTPVVESSDRQVYRITYSDEATLVSPVVTEVGGLTLESRSRADGWLLHLQLAGHEALYELNEFASEAGIRLDVLELHQDDAVGDRASFGLTDSQAEALMTAYVHGYFDEPREASLEELSAQLDISETAVSGRLRRGSARLVEAVLTDGKQDH
jgi:predicted DNA binding protein